MAASIFMNDNSYMYSKIDNITGNVLYSTKIIQLLPDVWIRNNQLVIMDDDTLVTSVQEYTPEDVDPRALLVQLSSNLD